MKILTAALLGLLLLPRTGWAQDFEAAAKHFGAAQRAFHAKQFAQAATQFQAAYDITRDPVLLYNIAECWQQAGEKQKAVAGYRAYLAAQFNAADRAEVEARIRALEGPPIRPPEREPIESGAVLAPTFSTPTPAPAPADAPPGPGMRAGGFVTLGVAVAAFGTAIGLAVAANSEAEALGRILHVVEPNGQPPRYDASHQGEYDLHRQSADQLSGASIGLFAAAGAAAVVAVTLFTVDGVRRHRAARPSAFRLVPGLGPERAALFAVGSF